MTTLLTHNAVVSIRMENFKNNRNNKENESLSEIVEHRSQESSTPQNNSFSDLEEFLDNRLNGITCILTSTEY